jgi:hypothetical protein
MTLDDPRLRAQFTREAVLSSDWYGQRLRTRQRWETALWERHVHALEEFRASGLEIPPQLDLEARLAAAKERLARVASPNYVNELAGTIGADPLRWLQ